jgi:hypothetical protein
VPLIVDLDTDSTLHISQTTSEGIDVQVHGLVFDSTASGTALELYEAKETVSMAGVTQTTTNSNRKIIAIQKEKNTTSDIIVGRGSDGKMISRIPGWETRPLFQKVQFTPVPTGQTVEVAYFKRPSRIVSESDALDPGVNEEAVVWRTVGNLHWMDNETQSAQVAWAKAEEVISIKRNEEQLFGEKDHHVEPSCSYMDLENEYWED